jgi:hypothetical protein
MLANITRKIFVPLSLLETNSEWSVYEKYVIQFERTPKHILASCIFVPPPPDPNFPNFGKRPPRHGIFGPYLCLRCRWRFFSSSCLAFLWLNRNSGEYKNYFIAQFTMCLFSAAYEWRGLKLVYIL